MRFETQLETYYFKRYILEVAIATLEQGMTASKLETYRFLPPVDAWGFPKYPGRTVILPPGADLSEELVKFVEANEPHLREPDCWLGTWINPHTQHCYLDITTSCRCLEEARRVAMELSTKGGRKIVAIYNAKLDETVYLWDDFRG